MTGALDWLRDLSPALRFTREARRMTLREVADQAGVSASTLSRIEQGKEADFHSLISVANWIAWPPLPSAQEDGEGSEAGK